LFNYFFCKKTSLLNDILSGITVSLVLVPTAISFSFIAGVSPLSGLYGSFVAAILTSLIGGRPGMISGSASALAVVIASLVTDYGVQYLFAAVIIMGVIQVLAGVFRLGKFMRLVPHSVMLGFINGLAIVIFLSQLAHFRVTDATGQMQWIVGKELWIMLGLVGIGMLIIHFLPKLTRIVPASLAAVVAITLLVYFFAIPTRLIGDVALIEGGFPPFNIPSIPYTLETLKIILPYAVILAVVGLIQSHMTLQFVDEVTEIRGNGDKEFLGQGIANIVIGFFTGMGASATIPYSVVNINSGGRGRISGVVAGVFLLLYILIGYSLIELIPVAALVAVMFMVCLSTFEWSSFRLLGKIPKSDAFVILLVSLTTVFTDLSIAVFFGVIVSALVFAWDKSKRINIEKHVDPQGVKHYKLIGPLFFASAKTFQNNFDSEKDPKTIVIDFSNSRICDHSGIEVISSLIEKYEAIEKKVLLRNLSPDCKNTIAKAGIHH
jgi:SulP family sulfate permease